MKTIRRRSILFGMAAMAGTTASPASSSRKVRVAVIGLGHAHAFGKLNALRALPQYELAGVFDGDPRLVEKSGAPLLTVDAILKNPGIELALIEGRVQDNLRCARMAVEAGKFVHLDKAPGEDLEDLKEILAEATRRKRVVQMGYQWRYMSGMRQAIEAARNGWLGPSGWLETAGAAESSELIRQASFSEKFLEAGHRLPPDAGGRPGDSRKQGATSA